MLATSYSSRDKVWHTRDNTYLSERYVLSLGTRRSTHGRSISKLGKGREHVY